MKKSSKNKKIYAFLFLFIFFIGGISIQGAMVSSTMQGYFGDKSIEETFTDEQNDELKEYLINKTEEVNQSSTYYENGSRIGKMQDYYGTDQKFKLAPAYVQAYVKYKKLSQNYNPKKDMDSVKKEISNAAEVLKPKFVYRNFEKITKRTVEETSTDPKTGASTTHRRVEITKENMVLVVHAENIEKTFNIIYKMSTETFGDTTITKPMIDAITEEGKEYDNLKKAISNDFNGDEDINKAADAIVTIAKQYIDEYAQNMSSIGGGAGFIPLFLQWDSKWANYPYSSSNLAVAGCGPTCLAMVTTGLEGNIGSWDKNGDKILTPDEAANFSTSNGGVVPGAGTVGDVLFSKAASTFGLNCRHFSKSEYSKVLQELSNGHPVIANVHGSESITYGSPGSTFTQHGHFIVLTGIDENGKIKVNDPSNGLNQSSKSWDWINIIVAESSDFWAFDNPNMKNDIFEATAYTSSAAEGGSGTAIGTISLDGKDLRNKLIAVDRNIIKLGSLVYISVPADKRFQKMPDGTLVDMNGAYTAVDTGNLIKGHGGEYIGGSRTAGIDFYFGGPSYINIANSFGRQKVMVRIKK